MQVQIKTTPSLLRENAFNVRAILGDEVTGSKASTQVNPTYFNDKIVSYYVTHADREFDCQLEALDFAETEMVAKILAQ